MSRRSVLRGFMNIVRAWPVCLAGAVIAYFTIAGMLLFLAPDIAELIVNGILTARLVLTMAILFIFLNLLLVSTCATSLFILKRESIAKGFRKNCEKLVKGLVLVSIFAIVCLAIMILAGYQIVFSTNVSQDAFKSLVISYGVGLVVSVLFAIPLIWLITSIAGRRPWIGLSRLLSVVALVFLMLAILSTSGLLGLFIDSLLIPTMVSLAVRIDGEVENKGIAISGPLRFKDRNTRKKVVATILTILILSAEAPFGNMLFAIGEEARFNEDRLRELVSKAIAEGWSNEELANAIKNDPKLSMLLNYDLGRISIERNDAGDVEVIIPPSAMGYEIWREVSNKTTVYDVYLQSDSSVVRIGNKRYVLSGYKNEEKTYGPFGKLEDALAKEKEVKKNANATRIFWNTTRRTESQVVTGVKTKYAIVPTVIETKYNVIAEYEDYQSARYHGAVHAGVAQVRTVEKQVWVESYRLELVKEIRDCYEAMRMKEYGYVIKEVYKTVTVCVFSVSVRITIGMGVAVWYPVTTWEYEKGVFESKLRNGEITVGSDGYYYTTLSGTTYRLGKTKEEQRQASEVEKYQVYRKVDTSHWETKKVYQVAIPMGHEERKISVDELPGYAKGFEYRQDAEKSKSSIEAHLRKWVEEKGLAYKSCQIESYEETVTKLETVTNEVKQYYVSAIYLKPVYDVYELKPYSRVWEETRYEEKYGWVFKGYVYEKPKSYDMATWVYSPEVSNWTSKTYLGIFTEWEAQVLTNMDPRYVAEKHNTTTITREIAYYDVYNATWRLLYHHYKYFIYPLHEYLSNGNVSSSEGWVFDSIGDAKREICSSTYRSSPSSLRITTRSGRGAWRQSFYFDAGGASPTIDFWYMLRGSGAVAIRKPDGSAHLFTLRESSDWSRFFRNSTDIFDEAGYYTVSFVASEDSELFVDDASVHVGGYGEWRYQGKVEKCPDEIPPDERYEPFYRIEDKKLIGTFEESVANQYPTPPYIKEFKKREKVSYVVDLYRLYYLEDGVVRYKVYHWEKYKVPIVVRKEETGASWVKVESGVETHVGQRILIDSNVPENVVRAKYNDPTKYYLVPKVVDAGKTFELMCVTFDETLANKYDGKEGYKVNKTRVPAGNPIKFSIRVLQASVEKNELGMLGKQNTLKVFLANPTGDTLTYQVVLETMNEKHVKEEAPRSIPAPVPGVTDKIYSSPIAEPNSWLVTIPPGGASYLLPFTVWIRREYEGPSGSWSEKSAYWEGGAIGCNFLVKVLRNGRLVAKHRILETFENFDIGRTIARHPFETVGGFLAGFGGTAVMTAISIAFPVAGTAIAIAGLALSSLNAVSIYLQTGSVVEALTYSPLGIVIAPIRALGDPTMDDSRRASIIGAMIGAPLGSFVGKQIALDVAMLRMPSELRSDPGIYGKLYGIENNYGTPVASAIARSIGKIYPHLDVSDAKGLVNTILSGALASRQDALYIASMLEWASRMGDDFLSQHANDIMEWLINPSLRSELSPLLQLSPKEAFQLSQAADGDFMKMIRMAEFKVAWNKFTKFKPDAVKVFAWSQDRIEVGVERGLAAELYPNIQKGMIVEFDFSGRNVVIKGFLTYVEDKTVGDLEYLTFSFHVEKQTPAFFELLKEDLKVVPGQLVEKSFGFNAFSLSNGKLNPDKGTLSMDGSVRFSNGMVLRLEEPGVKLVVNKNPLETGMINDMLFRGRISGTSVIVSEEGGIQASYGGIYLPAVVTANALGLQLGLLAKPSGEILAIARESLAANGIQDPSLLNIVYPNGETSTVIYTGGGLQIPMLSYSSGAFVGVQKVETKVVWTGSIRQKEFYAQIASVSELLGNILGRRFSEELAETLLLNSLTDIQALDIANELLKNLEWLKAFSEEKRIELVKKIAYYVKKGETADEATQRAKKESEEYVKNLEKEMVGFCSSIADAQLASEMEGLLRHVLNTLGPDEAKWLLDLLRSFYYGTLAQSYGNRELANAKLRSIVEKVFEYPESKLYSCRLASVKVLQLMKLEEAVLKKTLEETLSSEGGEIVVDKFEKTIPEYGHIKHRRRLEKGLYLVRVTRKEDGKVFEWSSQKEDDSDILDVKIPSKFSNELVGREVEIEIIRYDYSMHFKSVSPNFYFSPRDGLTIDGREIEVEIVKPQSWSEKHGASMMVKLKQRSIYGKEVYFAFFEDGDFSLAFSEESVREKAYKATMSTAGNLLIIEYEKNNEKYKSIVPIIVQEWKEGEKYYLHIPLEGRKRIRLVEELRKIFGYYNTEALRKKIEEGELELVAYFDNKKHATCNVGTLEINAPEGAEILEYVEIQPCPKFSYSKGLSDEDVEKIRGASEGELGIYGRNVAKEYVGDGNIAEIGKAEFIGKEIRIKVTEERVDLVFRTKDNQLIIVEVKSSKTSKDELARYVIEGLEQLEGYKEHIQKYGLDLTEEGLGIEKGENIKAYIIVYVLFDLKSKEVRVGYELLPEG